MHRLEMHFIRLAEHGGSLDGNVQFVGIDRHTAGKTVVQWHTSVFQSTQHGGGGGSKGTKP
jgi:hypothetical protein